MREGRRVEGGKEGRGLREGERKRIEGRREEGLKEGWREGGGYAKVCCSDSCQLCIN